MGDVCYVVRICRVVGREGGLRDSMCQTQREVPKRWAGAVSESSFTVPDSLLQGSLRRSADQKMVCAALFC